MRVCRSETIRDVVVVAWATLPTALVSAQVASPSVAAPRPEITACHLVPAAELHAGGGVRLGGLSDLFMIGSNADGIVSWTLTDRGPNGAIGKGSTKQRTLLAPDFAPALVRLRIPVGDQAGEARIETVVPMTGRSGKSMTGRPNGVGRDEPIIDAASGEPLPADHNGIDPEGLVVLPDGSFWVSEEYRPSLLRMSAEGRVCERHVPAGVSLPRADARVIDDLPAAYGNRRDNRGFEGLALSPDATRLSVLLQSPLDHPRKGAATQTGNVRLLVVDAGSGRPVAEHVYRLGDPADPAWASVGAAPDDGKLCGLAALADGALLVLEQADGSLARLYRVDPTAATDTLPRTLAADAEPLETIADLRAVGIEPLPKVLVADLAPLLPRIRSDIGLPPGTAVKLEGLAVLDERRVLFVNDNDFGVMADPHGPPPRSMLWVVTLPAVLTGGEPSQSSDTLDK